MRMQGAGEYHKRKSPEQIFFVAVPCIDFEREIVYNKYVYAFHSLT